MAAATAVIHKVLARIAMVTSRRADAASTAARQIQE